MRTPTFVLAGLASLMLAACGGGGGGSSTPAAPPPPPPPPSPLTLTATTPANGATAGVDAAPTLSFDAAPDMASLTAGSVALSSSIGKVDARLELKGSSLAVTPVKPLVWGSHYQLRVSDAVRSAAGGKLTTAATFSFDTRMPKWNAMANIDGVGTNVDNLVSASNASGDTIVLWTQWSTDLIGRLMFSRYTASTQRWSAPLEVPGSKHPQSPNVAINDNGTTAVIWEEKAGGNDVTIKAVRYDPASGWGAANTISNAEGYKSEYGRPRIAMARNGNIIVAWHQYADALSGYSTTDVAYYDASSQQWAPARSLQSTAGMTSVVVDTIADNGDALVLWSGISGIYGVAYVSRYDAASKTWSATRIVGSESTIVPGPFYIGIDGSNNAVAIWIGPTYDDITTAHYDAATKSWGKAERLPFSELSLSGASMDSAGNIILVANGKTAAGAYTFESVRYDRSSNQWSAFPSMPGDIRFTIPLCMDPAGNAIVAWSDNSLDHATMTAMRYNAASGKWDAPQLVAKTEDWMSDPVLTMDQSGQAMLLWRLSRSVYSYQGIGYSRLRGF